MSSFHQHSNLRFWLALGLALVSPVITLEIQARMNASKEGRDEQRIVELEAGQKELKADHKEMKERIFDRLGHIDDSLARLEQLHQGKLAK